MKLHETEIFNKLTQLRNLFTDARVEKIDKLDVDVSTRQAAQTAVEQKNELAQKIDAVPIVVPRCKIITTAGAGQFVVPANVYMLTVDYSGAGGTSGGGAAVLDAVIDVIPGQIINYSVGTPSSTASNSRTTIDNVGLISAPGARYSNSNLDDAAFGVGWNGEQTTTADKTLFALNRLSASPHLVSGGWVTGTTVYYPGGSALMIYNNAGKGALGTNTANPGCIVFRWWEPVLATKINQE